VLLRLSYLSPDIIRAIVAGEQPIELTPMRLVALSRNLPHDWEEQSRLLGFTCLTPRQSPLQCSTSDGLKMGDRDTSHLRAQEAAILRHPNAGAATMLSPIPRHGDYNWQTYSANRATGFSQPDFQTGTSVDPSQCSADALISRRVDALTQQLGVTY
jgi:hypothetical protein